jgi:4-amino-4-deoxy-L-arabinose transferase-like glycosyltransferase
MPRAGTRASWLVPALLIALVLARLAGMEFLPLMDTTEARYGEIGRKMAQLGDWVTPWHDVGVPFWGKPPLSFWLTALSFKVFGTGEFAARLPHFLSAAGIAWCVWRLGSLRSREQGWLALVLLASSALFYVSAGAVMTDAALVLGTTIAMVGFWEGVQTEGRSARRRRWLLFVGAAIGLLAKGPLALVLIGLPIAGWTLGSRRIGEVWRAFPWLAGTVLVVLVAAPWYVLAEQRTPGFLDYFLVGEHWHRFVTPGWTGDRYGTAHRFPPGTVWLFAFAAALPWSLILPAAALYRRFQPAGPREVAHDRSWRLYLLAWSLAPLLFFTAARNIIWTYALPALPALALLTAGELERWPARMTGRIAAAGLALALAGALGLGAYAVASGRADDHSARALVQAYERECRGPLIYLGSRPFSASFYTAGRAERVDDASALPRVLGRRVGCVVANTAQLAAVRALPGADADVVARVRGDVLVKVVLRPVDAVAGLAPSSIVIATSPKGLR